MPVVVTAHAIDRFRQRFPPAAAWDDAEVSARVRWHVGRAVQVGWSFGRHKRMAADAGLVFVLVSGRVVTVMTEPMLLVDVVRDRKRRRW